MGIANIRCYLGKHVRSRGRARRMDYGWHSYCRSCGIEMIKEDGGEWIVMDPPEATKSDPSEAPGLIEEKAPAKRSRLPRLLRRKRPI